MTRLIVAGLLALTFGIPALRAAFDHAASPHLSGNALALYRGMVLGRREHFEPELLEAMKRAGTTHLLAVSGLNVAVLVVFTLGNWAQEGSRSLCSWT